MEVVSYIIYIGVVVLCSFVNQSHYKVKYSNKVMYVHHLLTKLVVFKIPK